MQYVENILDTLTRRKRTYLSTKQIDHRIREAIKAALIVKGVRVTWTGQHLVCEVDELLTKEDV
jgi:hypothetical protein